MKQKYSIYNLIGEFEYYEELKKEIEKLKEIKSVVKIFFALLKKQIEKNDMFLNLHKYSFDGFGNILINFVNENSRKLMEYQKKSQGIDVFINFMVYYSTRKNIGSLEGFENHILYYIDTLKTNKKDDLFAFVGEDIFWDKVLEEVENFIDDLIEELEDEIGFLENGNILKEVEKNISDVLAENLDLVILSYKEIFKKIINVLYFDKKATIVVILNENELVEKNEILYHFIEGNYDKLSQNTDGKLICDLILSLNENMFENNFEEIIQEFELGDFKIVQLPYIFDKLLETNYIKGRHKL